VTRRGDTEGAAGDRAAAGPAGDPTAGLGLAELADVVDAVDEAVVVFDERGDVVTMNPVARQLHGCVGDACRMSHAGYVDRYTFERSDGTPVPDAERPLARALRGEAVRDVELKARDAETGRRWTGIYSAVPLVSAEGRKLVTETIRDVTELRRAYEALRDADRRKDEYLAMLSHELRNPLAPIRSAVFLLERADPASDGARRAREVIARQVGHLARMVDDLLDVSRLARGRIELRRARLDLAELVRRVGEDHRLLLAERGVQLEVQVPSEPVPVDGDGTRIAQLLGNLLQNAGKFTPRGGRVLLSLAVEEGRVALRVRDTGAGIDPVLLGQVFEPFVQEERTLARSTGGLGLGLPLVKGLTELHGGSVEARSEGPGAGTEFVVRLPLALGRGDGAAAEGGTEHAQAAGRSVLVVDDNVDAAESLCEVVAFLGHSVEAVHDGMAALERVRERHPDVVLCDIGLPGMDGYEVARAIRADAALAGIRLVAVSGYAQPEDRARASSAGFDAHVAKPADPSLIERLIT
jgi:signal transduction histidine kinase/CheY-like chemotaxis protein